ncbi:MAG TPA: DUF87 domain-containing protein [Patescibacteria group bacterium]|nr:DUF87 domain-containing protein [Patescibacteria group bacterium]
MKFNRYVTVAPLVLLAFMLVSPPAFATDLSNYAQQQIDQYNANNPYLNGQSNVYIPTPTPTSTPNIIPTNVHLTSEAKEDLKILQQIKNNKKLNYTQYLLMYIALMLPIIPLTWKIHMAQFVSTLPLPGMSSFLFSTILLFWPLISLVLMLIFLALIFVSIRGLYRTGIPFIFRRFLKDTTEKIFLELTFPSDTAKSSYATEQLYRLLHTLARRRSRSDDLTKRKKTYSLEVVAQRGKGIRFVIQVVKEEAEIVKRNLLSYLPGIKVREISDYINDSLIENKSLGIAELKQLSHHVLPLYSQKVLTEHDPMSYLTGNMTNLKEGDLVVFQVVITPLLNSIHWKILDMHRKYRHIITKGEPLRLHLQQNVLTELLSFPGIHEIYVILKYTLIVLFNIFKYTINFVIDVMTVNSKSGQAASLQPAPIPVQQILNPYEQELQTIVKGKLDQHMFETSIRLLVAGADTEDLAIRMEGLVSSFGQMNSNNQSLGTKRTLPFMPQAVIINKRFAQFKNRALSPNRTFNQNPILSTSEISDLYHFPYTDTTKTEDMVKSLSQELPAPLLLKQDKTLDVVFGKNTYGSSEVAIGLTDDERSRHMYLIGQTGAGKSTVLFHMAKDDIQKGRGVCIIDPHGDLVEDLLAVIPKSRLNDVVYINPFDIKHPVNINLLELTPYLDEDDAELEKELVAESVISIFRRIFQKDEQIDAHRIEYILRNTIYTAFYVKDATIFTIFDLLTDEEFRKEIVAKVDDYHLRNFWKQEFEKAGDYQVVKMISGVTAKVGRFLFSPIARRILEKPHSTVSFDKLLDEGKIVLCNVSEGKLSEDTSQLIGTTIITKIHLAMLKRARIDKALRKPFYLSIDEFQNFATPSFTKLLSGGRKFGLRVTIAEQSTTQQDNSRITNMILANVGTVVCFKTASPVDEELLLPQFSPLVKKGEIINLPRFHFYIKLGSIDPQEPFSGVTLPIQNRTSKKKIEQVIATSQKNYASIYVKPKMKKVTNHTEGTTKQNGKTGKKRRSVNTLTD